MDEPQWQPAGHVRDNRYGRFTRSEPAASALELMAFLKEQEHGSPYIYRGQTRCYKSILPSGYRHLCSRSDKPGQWNINTAAHFETEPQSVRGIKNRLMNGLLRLN